MVALLVDAGGVPQSAQLHAALKLNRVAIVKAMLARVNEPLGPLLDEALRRHQAEMVEVILKAGADVNARGKEGFTALHDAALSGNVGAVQILLDHGADINATDRDSGATPLYMAATMGREEVVNLLLEKGADTKKGPSAVKAAQTAGFDKVAAAIREHGTKH